MDAIQSGELQLGKVITACEGRVPKAASKIADPGVEDRVGKEVGPSAD